NRYDGDDNSSMADNNTSAFNDRKTAFGNRLSLHAYGLAIDINPIQNPYLSRVADSIRALPRAGIAYANRRNDRPWKAVRPGMAESVIDVFADNGFVVWGGYWDNPIDYQHFAVSGGLVERLAQANPIEAEFMFKESVERYRKCRQSSPEQG